MNRTNYLQYRSPAELAADTKRDEEREAHEQGSCWGDRRCEFCRDAEDIDGMIDHVNNELEQERRKA